MLTIVVAVAGPLVAAWCIDRARLGAGGSRVAALGRARAVPGERLLSDALASGEIGVSPREALQWWGIAIAAIGLVMVGIAPPLAPWAMAGTVASGPTLLWARRHRRSSRAILELPELLEIVAGELRSGDTVVGALRHSANHLDALRIDLDRVLCRVELGATMTVALRRWSEERDHDAVRAVAAALSMGSTMGGPSANALVGLATSLRARTAAEADARALSTQARLSAWVVGLAPLLFLALSAGIDPQSVAVLLSTNAGRVCLAVGLLLEGLAVLWMRRLVRFAG